MGSRAAEKRRRQRERKAKLNDDVERVLKNKSPVDQVGDLADDQLFFIDEAPGRTATALAGRSSGGDKRKGGKAGRRPTNQKALDKALKSKERSDWEEREREENQVYDLWGGTTTTTTTTTTTSRAKRPRHSKESARKLRMNTVVEPAGCSYNPRYEDHQDVVAEIVAEDAQKNLLKSANQSADLAVVGDADKGGSGGRRRIKPAEVPNQNVVSVKKTLKQVKREERDREERTQRKREDAEARKKVLPPRLGRKRYEEETKKVATTDEIEGSIRTLRSTPMVANSVFNKLQRKGLIEPRDEAVKRRKRRYVRA